MAPVRVPAVRCAPTHLTARAADARNRAWAGPRPAKVRREEARPFLAALTIASNLIALAVARPDNATRRDGVASHGADVSTTADPQANLRRRARWLAFATIGWNTIEAVVAVTAGAVAGSSALIGFGLDSAVEVSASTVALWYLAGVDEDREHRALRLIRVSFFALAVYITFDAGRDLLTGAKAETSTVGIVLAALSLVVMPLLARAKRRTGERLGSRALIAESAETQLCAYLSAILLAGLVLRATVGWTWADPLAALGIALLAAREGREAWRGEDCC